MHVGCTSNLCCAGAVAAAAVGGGGGGVGGGAIWPASRRSGHRPMTFPCPSSSSSRSPCPGNGISSLLSALLCCRPANHINALLPLSHCACVSVCVCWCVRARPKVWLPQKNKEKWKEKWRGTCATFCLVCFRCRFALSRRRPTVSCCRLSPVPSLSLLHIVFYGSLSSLLPALSFCLSLSLSPLFGSCPSVEQLVI